MGVRLRSPQLNTFMYTQKFPWFGTLGLRERVAVQAAVAQYHQYVDRAIRGESQPRLRGDFVPGGAVGCGRLSVSALATPHLLPQSPNQASPDGVALLGASIWAIDGTSSP